MEEHIDELEGFTSDPGATGATFRVVKGETSRTFARWWLEVSGFSGSWLIGIDIGTAGRGFIGDFEVLP